MNYEVPSWSSLTPIWSLFAFGASLLTTLLLLATVRWHHRLSLDENEGVQRSHSEPTARIGGVAVLVGVLVGCVFLHPERRGLLWTLLLCGAPAFAFGLAEDLTKRVSVLARLLATMACGVLGYAYSGHAITQVGVPGLDWLLGFPLLAVAFTAFAAGGVANAINIIDGMNGIALGVILIILGSFALLGGALGDHELVQSCLVMGAAALGLMLLNWPMGKIFLGDGGAYFLGFCVAWLAVTLLARHPEVSAWTPLLICGFPVLEVMFSVLRRWRRRQKVGGPDAMHLHSLVKRRLARRLLPNSSKLVRNSVTGAIMWLAGLLPACIGLYWVGNAPALAAGFVVSAFLYSASYARLTQFRWCIGAPTMRAPVLAATRSDVP